MLYIFKHRVFTVMVNIFNIFMSVYIVSNRELVWEDECSKQTAQSFVVATFKAPASENPSSAATASQTKAAEHGVQSVSTKCYDNVASIISAFWNTRLEIVQRDSMIWSSEAETILSSFTCLSRDAYIFVQDDEMRL